MLNYTRRSKLLLIIAIWSYLQVCKYLAAQVRRYIAYRDKEYLYFAVFGIFFIIDQIFYVFYADLYLISFFILVATHSETYHQKRMGVI